MKDFIATLATIWRLAVPYYRSEDRWPGRILLAATIATELAIVGITVLINQWNNRFYNALQERNWDAFVSELLYFSLLATIFIVLAVYQLYLNQWLQIRWRRWMTKVYLGDWLAGANHYRMQLLGDAADNPDQRIADDIRLFVASTLSIGIGFLSSVVTLASFIVILWSLSEAAPLHMFGATFDIPGYLVWAALVYALAGTAVTHYIGRPLIGLNFMQQRYEADFRFNLVRVRENSEQIALLSGESAEKNRLLDQFGRVVTNWIAIMNRQKRLTFFTSGYSQFALIFPFIVVAPAYFANTLQLGGVMQTASAFGSVQSAFSFFITVYRELAEWRAVIERLAGFERAVAAGHSAGAASPKIDVREGDRTAISLRDLVLKLPNGAPLLNAADLTVSAGEHVLVTGPSGSGKSTLFRALAGIWPFGGGSITIPRGAKLMMLPQRPYFPVGRLASAIAYPAEPGTFDDARIAEAIAAAGLPQLAARIGEDGHWNRMLSLGEQQRLAVARALLHAPDYLFLDEATASLDEPAEAALYKLLFERLKDATVVSIGHRATLAAFHRRGIALAREGDRWRLQEKVQEQG